MSEITVLLPDGSARTYPKGASGLEIAKSIGARLAKDALAISVDGVERDLSYKLNNDAKIRILTFDTEEGKKIFWHSTSHVMAQAIKRIYPYAKLTIGPASENGFYYDVAHDAFHPDSFYKIEKEMEKIVSADFRTKRRVIATDEAKKIFMDNKYKLELIEEHSKLGEEITVYDQGEFTDLCTGPHVPSTGMIKAFKLTKVSAAYWRADSKNDSLQRIYGISFPDKKRLDAYLKVIEEAEKRDHRKIGRESELFMFHDWSPGSAFFLPKGTVIFNELQKFLREEYDKRGYSEVITPQLFNKSLWELSGHWNHYKENMFVLKIDNDDFSVKPMNCPSHVLIFKSKSRSYRDLPMRIADFCNLHRNELKGVLSGLTRVRKFSQDDAHIFCTKEQIAEELDKLLEFTKYVYQEVFDFKFAPKLSTRPDEFLGESELWDEAEKTLESALKKNKIEYEVQSNEGAFYGPKIDVDVKDAIGRNHQLATIQLDFQTPKRMGVAYEGADGKKHFAVIIHRAIFGSFERFIGLLVEHYAGRFPVWLAPEQVRILSVSDKYNKYAEKVQAEYKKAGIRATIDTEAQSVPYKVREAQLARVNYILVVGEKEEKNNSVTIRDTRRNKIEEKKTEDFLNALKSEVENKTVI